MSELKKSIKTHKNLSKMYKFMALLKKNNIKAERKGLVIKIESTEESYQLLSSIFDHNLNENAEYYELTYN